MRVKLYKKPYIQIYVSKGKNQNFLCTVSGQFSSLHNWFILYASPIIIQRKNK